MLYILTILFIILSFVVGIKIINQFKDGFDWFSFALYSIIFLVSVGLIYVTIFGLYYAIIN